MKFFSLIILIILFVKFSSQTAKAANFHNLLSPINDRAYKKNVAPKKKINRTPAEVKKVPTEAERLAEEDKLKEEKRNYGQLILTIMPSKLSITGEQVTNGSKGVINSKTYNTFRVGYLHLYKKWRFFTSLSYKQFEAEKSDEQTINNAKQSTYVFDLQLTHTFKKFAFGAGVGKEGRLFYKAINSTTISIEKRMEERMWLAFEYELLKQAKHSLRSTTRVGISPSTKSEFYDAKTGAFVAEIFKYGYQYSSDKNVGAQFFFKYNKYNTDQLKLNSTEMGIGFNFSLDIGDSK